MQLYQHKKHGKISTMMLGLAALLAFAGTAQAQTIPEYRSTFHSISIYWTPTLSAAGRTVRVKYKRTTESTYRLGYSIPHNNITSTPGSDYQRSVYRGSLVHLNPNTDYHIQLELLDTDGTTVLTRSNGAQPMLVKTMSESFSGSNATVTVTANRPYAITQGGSVNSSGVISYRVYDGLKNGSKSVIDLQNSSAFGQDGITVNQPYVIIRNFKIMNVTRHGINLLSGAHHVVIENCEVTKWGSRSTWSIETGNSFGRNHDAAIYSGVGNAGDFIVQRNVLHNPNYTANRWGTNHPSSKDANGNWEYSDHPKGPQCIEVNESSGGNIFRYNECYNTSSTLYFNDAFGGSSNSSGRGYPGADSDIYGNYIYGCADDGIEAEGGGRNVRIFRNYIDRTHVSVANAAVTVGPQYFFRNICADRTLYGVKMGIAGSDFNVMQGWQYFFNNTFLRPASGAMGGWGTYGTNARTIRKVVSRNNIIQGKDGDENVEYVISRGGSNTTTDTDKNDVNRDLNFNYDLYSHLKSSLAVEANGIKGVPQFVSGGSFDRVSLTASYELVSISPGYDDGVRLDNFCEEWEGAAPDMGAHEKLSTDPTYGRTCNYNAAAGMRVAAATKTATAAPDEETASLSLSASPNPATSTVRIGVKLPRAEAAELQMVNAAGQVIAYRRLPATDASTVVELPLGGVAAGVYTLRLQQNKSSKQLRLVVQ